MPGAFRYLGARTGDQVQAKKFWPKMAKALAEGYDASAYGGGNDGAIVPPSVTPPPPSTITLTAIATPSALIWQFQQQGGTAPFQYDFGDGQTATTSLDIYEHTYTAAGVYEVTLTDANGAIGRATVEAQEDLRGPFTTGGIVYWVRVSDWTIAFDVDGEPGPDVFVPIQNVLAQLDPRPRQVVRAKARDLGWTG